MKQLSLIISLLIFTYSGASAQVDTTSQHLQDVVVTAAPGVKNRYRTEPPADYSAAFSKIGYQIPQTALIPTCQSYFYCIILPIHNKTL
ncbi:MAG: hypothetical protein ACI4AM_03195 [Muribaculaceae bacterium]